MKNVMKDVMKNLVALTILLSISMVITLPLNGQETTTTEAVEVVVTVSPLLKNIIYVRVMSSYNGIDYYTGVLNPRDTEIKEYNLESVVIRLKEDTIPISKENVKSLYVRTRERLKKPGLRVLDIQQQDKKQATLVPTLNLAVDAIATSESNYVVLVNLSLTKWISTWAGTENIQAPVIVWWHKVLLTADGELLVNSLEEAADEVLDEFLNQLAVANPKPETEPAGNSGSTGTTEK